MTQLTDQEKASVINSHIKNLQINKYNVELNLLELNTGEPQQDMIDSANNQITRFDNQIKALQDELVKLDLTESVPNAI